MAVSLMGPATGLTNSKLAMADTTAGRVVKGDTFYAGDKNIKTGRCRTVRCRRGQAARPILI